jgi:hypothetical protein
MSFVVINLCCVEHRRKNSGGEERTKKREERKCCVVGVAEREKRELISHFVCLERRENSWILRNALTLYNFNHITISITTHVK